MKASFEAGFLDAISKLQSALWAVQDEFVKESTKQQTTCSCGHSRITSYTHKLGKTCNNCGFHIDEDE